MMASSCSAFIGTKHWMSQQLMLSCWLIQHYYSRSSTRYSHMGRSGIGATTYKGSGHELLDY